MIDGLLPIQPRQRFTLRIGNGDDRHIAKFLVKRYEVGNIQASMQRGQCRNIFIAASRIVQVINMKMNEVKVVLFREHAFHQQDMVRQRIDAVGCEDATTACRRVPGALR